MEKEKIWFLCNGKDPECKKTICYKNDKEGKCRHTSKIEYAENFEKKKNPSGVAYREKP